MMRRFVHFRETDLEMIWHFVILTYYVFFYLTGLLMSATPDCRLGEMEGNVEGDASIAARSTI